MRKTDRFEEYARNMQPLQVEFQPIQFNEQGQAIENVPYHPMVKNNVGTNLKFKASQLGNKLANLLLGQQATPTDAVDTDAMAITTSENPTTGGLINDISGGFNENFKNSFNTNNLRENKLADGRNKGFAYRLGEGLGSIARIGESPLGRGLLMAGLVGATGGGALPALAFGGVASLGNQQNRMRNQLYRTQLQNMGIDTDNIRGYIGDNTFAKIVDANIAQENAAYRRMYYDQQGRNDALLLGLKQQEAAAKQKQQNIDNAFRNREISIKEQEALNNKDTTIDKQALKEMELQLDDFVSTFDSVNNPYRYRIAGGVSNALNTLTPEEANFNAKRTLLFNAIARKLSGEKGVLSDQDIKRIDDALPKLSDNKNQKNAKMQATYALLDIKKGYKTPRNLTNGATKSGIKYEVID